MWFLVLMKVLTQQESSPTGVTCVQVLCRVWTLMFSQVENVFQEGVSSLTWMDFLDKWTGPRSSDLWHSFYTNTLLGRGLLIVCFTPTTWKQRMLVKDMLTLVGSSKSITSECVTHQWVSPWASAGWGGQDQGTEGPIVSPAPWKVWRTSNDG